jgi:hypothetical protein
MRQCFQWYDAYIDTNHATRGRIRRTRPTLILRHFREELPIA